MVGLKVGIFPGPSLCPAGSGASRRLRLRVRARSSRRVTRGRPAAGSGSPQKWRGQSHSEGPCLRRRRPSAPPRRGTHVLMGRPANPTCVHAGRASFGPSMRHSLARSQCEDRRCEVTPATSRLAWSHLATWSIMPAAAAVPPRRPGSKPAGHYRALRNDFGVTFPPIADYT